MRPLHAAAEAGHTKLCDILVNCGADVNARTVPGGDTLVHIAAGAERMRVLKWAVSKGLDLQVANEAGQLPVDIAAARHYLHVVDYLRKAVRHKSKLARKVGWRSVYWLCVAVAVAVAVAAAAHSCF